MDLCFNKIVRTACGGFLLMLTGAISGAQVGSISFDGQTFLHAITDTKGGDRFVEFRGCASPNLAADENFMISGAFASEIERFFYR
jgi:hypothetical protein